MEMDNDRMGQCVRPNCGSGRVSGFRPDSRVGSGRVTCPQLVSLWNKQIYCPQYAEILTVDKASVNRIVQNQNIIVFQVDMI